MRGQWRFEAGVLRMRGDFAVSLGLAGEFEFDAPALAIRGGGGGGQLIFAIGQREAIAERAVGPQLDRASADGHFRARLGRAVEDQFRVHTEPKRLAARRSHPAGRAGNGGGNRIPGRRQEGRGGFGRLLVVPLAADEFGDFQRANPDAAHGVHRHDLGQRSFLRGRPLRGDDRWQRGQAAHSSAAELFDRFEQREVVLERALDQGDQFVELHFRRQALKPNRKIVRHGIRRRQRGGRGRNADPLIARTVVAQLGLKLRAAQPDVREPVARFRVDVNLPIRLAAGLVLVDAQHQMAVHGAGVVFLELFTGQIPVRVKPVRVARGEQQPLRAIRFRQRRQLRPARGRRGGGRGSEGVTLAGTAGGRGRRGVAFEQKGGNLRHGFLRRLRLGRGRAAGRRSGFRSGSRTRLGRLRGFAWNLFRLVGFHKNTSRGNGGVPRGTVRGL